MLAVLAGVTDACFPIDTSIRTGRLVTDRHGTVLSAFLSSDQKWRFTTAVHEVSPVLVQSIIHKEDRRFRMHGGVDPVAILRAMVGNMLSGRRTSGASTITMQVVRLLEPRPRTVWSKCIEALRATQLEFHHSKDEILGMYLTLAPYGSNIEGVRAASLLYLGTTPDRLSPAEVAMLLIVPNRPTSLRLGGDDERLRRERDRWLRRLAADGLLTADAARDAMTEPLRLHRRATPRNAWHASVRLAREMPGASIVRSTLDAALQDQVEALTRHHVARLRALGIENASVMVIDNASRDVLAYVGSADPQDTATHGQVDGVQAVRSPGSTLKPLVYALAIDRGLLTPRTMLEDVPVNYDGYAPENFDRRYHGAVTMEQALATSLNVPAVTTLDRVGVDAMLDALQRARFASVARRRSDVGLSLILGGCGTRLEELTGLYAAFANAGRWRPLRWTPDAPRAEGAQLCSPGAAWMISECLTQLTRPDLPNNVELGARIPRIAWKTGTSYGRRDAWSIGYGRRFTVGVWVGNFDGRGNEHLTGSQCATPLLFDVVNAIDRTSDARWLERPSGVDMRFVCAMSGQPPSDSCADLVMDAFLPGTSSARPCMHQRETFVRTDGRMSYCTTCLPERGWTRRMELDMPAPVIAYMRQNGVALRVPPPHDPSCTRFFSAGEISITAPLHGKEYVLERAGETRLRCTATVPADATTVYWYMDDVFVTSAPAGGAVFMTPERGEHTLDCTDDRGRRARATFRVTYW